MLVLFCVWQNNLVEIVFKLFLRFSPVVMVAPFFELLRFGYAHIISTSVFRHSTFYLALLTTGANGSSEYLARWWCLKMFDSFLLFSLALFFLTFRLACIPTQRTDSSIHLPETLTDSINEAWFVHKYDSTLFARDLRTAVYAQNQI